MPKGRTKETHLKVTPRAEQRPLTGKPDCPKELTGVAKKEFNRLCNLLDELGILSEVDGSLLMLYSVAYERFLKAEAELKKSGYVQNYKGFDRQSPWVAISNEASKTMKEIATQFALSPASRRKMVVEKPAEGPDAFEAFTKKVV